MKTLRNIGLSLLAVAFAGCVEPATDDDLQVTTTRISCYPAAVQAGNEATTEHVIVTLNPSFKSRMNWQCELPQLDWVSAERTAVAGLSTGPVTEQAVALHFGENTAWKRHTTLVIVADDGTRFEVPVEQFGVLADAQVSVSKPDKFESFEFKADLIEPQTVVLEWNMEPIEVQTDAEWCIATLDEETRTLTVTCTEYDDETADRSATVTVHVGTPETSEATLELPVTQLRKDIYCYIFGSATPKYPTQAQQGQFTKLAENVYTMDVYLKDGVAAIRTTNGQAFWLAPDGKLSATETEQTVDIAGLRKVTVRLDEETYSAERITTKNCLPDSEVANYKTATYTANGRTKVWMRTALNWNGGPDIGTIKLGSRMVDPANNIGGYDDNKSSLDTQRVSDYDEEESGGKAKGEVEMTEKYGRIYTLTEFLTGTPKGALEITRLLTDWPEPYHPGTTFVDAIGNEIPMVGIKAFTNETFENAPTLSMQIQGICPYGWHVANVQDFYDMLCAAAEAKGAAVLSLSSMIGNWAVPDMLRSAEGWSKGTPTRHAKADDFGFDYFPQGRRLFKSGYQNYGVNGEMFICHPGGLSSKVYQSWRINALTNTAANLTVNTGYNIGDCAASFRCVKNYENY